MLIWLSNLNMGASPVSVVVTAPIVDDGADSGGGEPWWTGEWITPPRVPVPVRAQVPSPSRQPIITPRQRESLDEILQARTQAGVLVKQTADLEASMGEIEQEIERETSRRAKRRLYDRRERLARDRKRMGKEIEILEGHADRMAKDLRGLEWLTFLREEDERFMKMVLELI